MDVLRAYSLPIQGLKDGVHSFEYQLDQVFFSHFEGSPIEAADIEVRLELDKRPDLLVFDFDLTGRIGAECDRCTAKIQLPIEIQQQLMVKFGEADEDDDEIVFIPRESPDFNVAKYLYEYAVLAMPMISTYDCENDPEPPCNREVLAYLNQTEETKDNPVWDTLKNLSN
ncbi:MAG: YceD family protein [Saprospiraceae bacterium]